MEKFPRLPSSVDIRKSLIFYKKQKNLFGGWGNFKKSIVWIAFFYRPKINMCSLFFSNLYPVSKYFFVIQTIDRSKSYSPENKIVIDIPAGVTIFEDQLGILKHVKDVAKELADEWNAAFVDKPKVIF